LQSLPLHRSRSAETELDQVEFDAADAHDFHGRQSRVGQDLLLLRNGGGQNPQPQSSVRSRVRKSALKMKLLANIPPSKIVCVGRNYREHAAELGNKMPDEPLLFLKAPSAIISSGEEIVLPNASQQVEHEGELGVVIGRVARNIAGHEDPLTYVLGYTCVN